MEENNPPLMGIDFEQFSIKLTDNWRYDLNIIDNKKELNMYYTPEIEDIKVGSEIWFTNGEKNNHWSTILKTPHNVLSLVFGYTQDEKGQYSNYKIQDNVKFKYLTKEQIEAEGWVYTGKSTDIYFNKKGNFKRSFCTANNAILHYNLEDKWISIQLEGDDCNCFVLKGKCLSINEFREIIKLIEI